MNRLIKRFEDGSILEYDQGAFDEWCVYLTRPSVNKYAPKDFEYFMRIQEYSDKYGAKKLYEDYVSIYNLTDKSIKQNVLDEISSLSSKYSDDITDIDIDLTIIYAGMVAEENKAYTKLGKRVKRLGIYQILIEKMSYKEAANFSRGMEWRDIDKLCKERGF